MRDAPVHGKEDVELLLREPQQLAVLDGASAPHLDGQGLELRREVAF